MQAQVSPSRSLKKSERITSNDQQTPENEENEEQQNDQISPRDQTHTRRHHRHTSSSHKRSSRVPTKTIIQSPSKSMQEKKKAFKRMNDSAFTQIKRKPSPLRQQQTEQDQQYSVHHHQHHHQQSQQQQQPPQSPSRHQQSTAKSQRSDSTFDEIIRVKHRKVSPTRTINSEKRNEEEMNQVSPPQLANMRSKKTK